LSLKELKKPRKLVVLSDSETNWNYGYNPNQRPIEELMKMGFIVLDKQRGPTSHEVVATLKKILNIEKAGHTGTLEGFREILVCLEF